MRKWISRCFSEEIANGKLAALTLTSWNQLVADLTSIQAMMEHAEEKPSGQLVLATS